MERKNSNNFWLIGALWCALFRECSMYLSSQIWMLVLRSPYYNSWCDANRLGYKRFKVFESRKLLLLMNLYRLRHLHSSSLGWSWHWRWQVLGCNWRMSTIVVVQRPEWKPKWIWALLETRRYYWITPWCRQRRGDLLPQWQGHQIVKSHFWYQIIRIFCCRKFHVIPAMPFQFWFYDIQVSSQTKISSI